MAEGYHNSVPSTGICGNGLEVWGTAACRVLDGAARVPQIRCDKTIDMFDCTCVSSLL